MIVSFSIFYFAAWLYLFYNPIIYETSSQLTIGEKGRQFLIERNIADDPAALSPYKSLEFQISPDYRTLDIIARGKNPSTITKKVNAASEEYRSEIEKHISGKTLKGHSRLLEGIETQRSEYEMESIRISNSLEMLEERAQISRRQKESADVTASALKQRIITLEARRDSLLRVYTKSHPEVVGLNIELESLKEKLVGLPFVAGPEPLKRSINENEARYSSVKEKLMQLERRKTEILRGKQEPVVIIRRYAVIPRIPIGDVSTGDIYKRFIFFGLLIGLVLSISISALSDMVVSESQISKITDLPLIATVPFVKPKKGKGVRITPSGIKGISRHLLFLYDDASEYVNAYRSLATHIKLDAFKGNIDKKVIIFSSPAAKTGKSTVSANIAVSLARSGKKTVLLDAHLNRTSVAKFFGIGARVQGMSDILMKKAKLDDCLKNVTDMLLSGINWNVAIKTYGLDRLKILPSGTKTPDPAGLLESKALDELFQQLRQEFDCIVVDSPALLRSPDLLIFSTNADAVFIVCKTYLTSVKDARACSRKLKEVKTEYKGSVLVCT